MSAAEPAQDHYDNRIICGDAHEALEALPEASVDLIVTDPPYGYSFMGKEWDKAVPPVDVWRKCCRVLKPGAFAFVMSAPRQDVLGEIIRRLDRAGFVTGFTSLYWAYASGFPKALDISRAIDKGRGAKRATLGEKRVQDIRGGRYGSANQVFLRAIPGGPVTREAKAFNGAYGGFQPKPAVEVILVAMKPLGESTYMGQALANGKGVTWLGECRIPGEPPHHDDAGRRSGSGFRERAGSAYHGDPRGRFPANLVVSDRVLDYRPSDQKKPGNSFSRYFNLDRWYETRSHELPPDVRQTMPFLIVAKASRADRDLGLRSGGNRHPTVKPLRLMSYLVTLGSRKGDTVLDPFAGSGTTCLAARLLGRRYMGIEREAVYARLARARSGTRLKAS